jgi:hypothetical protein
MSIAAVKLAEEAAVRRGPARPGAARRGQPLSGGGVRP